MIWDNKRTGGDLWRCLRRRGKQYNRRGAQHAGRGVIPHRIDIAERPAIVARKSRLGDWEGDTIVGAHHKGALLTHVERKSLFTTISKLPRSTAHGRAPRHGASLKPLRDHVHTITYDNGKEFAGHQTHCPPPAGPDLLCHALSRVGTRGEREHEWPHPGLLPKGDGLHYNSSGDSGEG